MSPLEASPPRIPADTTHERQVAIASTDLREALGLHLRYVYLDSRCGRALLKVTDPNAHPQIVVNGARRHAPARDDIGHEVRQLLRIEDREPLAVGSLSGEEQDSQAGAVDIHNAASWESGHNDDALGLPGYPTASQVAQEVRSCWEVCSL